MDKPPLHATFDSAGYPTDEVLKTIEEYNLALLPVDDLITLIRELWKFADDTGEGAFVFRGGKTRRLELHTLGWSGNEEVISALQLNNRFWMRYWQRSERGGHYYFEIGAPEKVDKAGKRMSHGIDFNAAAN